MPTESKAMIICDLFVFRLIGLMAPQCLCFALLLISERNKTLWGQWTEGRSNDQKITSGLTLRYVHSIESTRD